MPDSVIGTRRNWERDHTVGNAVLRPAAESDAINYVVAERPIQ